MAFLLVSSIPSSSGLLSHTWGLPWSCYLFEPQINAAAKRGKKFVGFVSQYDSLDSLSPHCNGTSRDGDAELGLTGRQGSHDNCKSWIEGDAGGQLSESGVDEEPQRESGQETEGNSSPGCSRPELGGGNSMDGKTMYSMFPKLYILVK